jgi:NAD(P)-dependent dehydrogenase (short-subunit alcohol dehydrogenase family)
MVEEAAAWLGGIDVLVNNAGIAVREPFLEVAVERFDDVISVNLRGAFIVAQAVARHMVDRGGGTIINMSSTNGLAGERNYAPYNSTKAAILVLTQTMAIELGEQGVRVNAVCPGYIQTPLNDSIAASLGGEQSWPRTRRRSSPEPASSSTADRPQSCDQRGYLDRPHQPQSAAY